MTEFVNYLDEVFELFSPISARKMFGGYGIFHQGLMFAAAAADRPHSGRARSCQAALPAAAANKTSQSSKR